MEEESVFGKRYFISGERIIHNNDSKKYVSSLTIYSNDGDGFIISSFGTKKGFLRRGYGERLLRHVINKYKILSLNVFKENEPAIALYKKVGFKIVDKSHRSIFTMVIGK